MCITVHIPLHRTLSSATRLSFQLSSPWFFPLYLLLILLTCLVAFMIEGGMLPPFSLVRPANGYVLLYYATYPSMLRTERHGKLRRESVVIPSKCRISSARRPWQSGSTEYPTWPNTRSLAEENRHTCFASSGTTTHQQS